MRRFLTVLALLGTIGANAQNKIKYYFNHPVDNTVSTGTNAIYLNSCLSDTLVAYINKAKYTIDVAVYNYTSTSPVGPAIATAINNAYNRGVVIRWIYDAGQSNTGLPLLNSAINKLGSPTTSDYTIMHNKFMVIDANSTDASDAIVWTGSTNWNTQQFNYDYNNVVILQDSALAHAYTAEFNMMWGGSGVAPNSATSKFGQYKTNLGLHNFTIDGKHVELYFSPSDGTDSKIAASINTADKDLYFGMYTFTQHSDATAITAKNSAGVYCAGILDNSSTTTSGSEYSTLNSALGSTKLRIYTGSGLYHDKYLIVDPSDKCSDPLVLTGSHNWTYSAETKNDENTLIIHSDIAANVYYQSFKADFTTMGGTLSAVTGGCPVEEPVIAAHASSVSVFPNPSAGAICVHYMATAGAAISVEIVNSLGQIVHSHHKTAANTGDDTFEIKVNNPGLYVARVKIGAEIFIQKVMVY